VRIKSQRDFFSGLLFVGLGTAFAWGATTMRIGSGQRMGPGWFPLALGVLLAVIGAFVIFGSLVVEREDGDPVPAWALRPVVCVLGAIVVFGALVRGVPAIGLPAMGMVAAMVALTFICSLAAGPQVRVKEALLLSVLLALASALVFVFVFGQPLPLWPAFRAR
jgi:hypothetical protein